MATAISAASECFTAPWRMAPDSARLFWSVAHPGTENDGADPHVTHKPFQVKDLVGWRYITIVDTTVVGAFKQKIIVKLDHFLKDSGWKYKIFENHYLD